jgi:GT2 family glycosyltransferase
MPRDLPAANVARSVPGVTGACLMIDKELYERVGGFPEIYLQGDHEDSEICLRLIQEGYENWYVPEVELYHLESRSYNMDLRVRLALYNRWLHSQRWGDFIAEIMPSYPLPEREGPPHYQEVGAARPFARSPQPQG